MKMTVSIDNNKTIVVMPFITTDTLSIDYGQSSNENKDSVKYGQIKVMGAEPLASINISSFFPKGKQAFVEPDAWEDPLKYVRFFRTNRKKGKAMRVVITGDNEEEIFNRLMACETFEISKVSKTGDIYCSLSFEQYRLVR